MVFFQVLKVRNSDLILGENLSENLRLKAVLDENLPYSTQ